MHLRRRSAPLLALALAGGALACGGADLTLPGDAQPTHIEAVTGDAQAGIAGTTLPLPLVVKITDDLGRPVAGQSVEFSVTAGGGELATPDQQTGADGRVSTTWALGPVAGAQQVHAQAVGQGLPGNLELEFTATAIAGSGSLIAAVSGDDQSASVSTVLAESLVVHVTDGTGNPVSGLSIQWTVQGGGSITPETTVTDNDGLAAAQRVLGPTSGRQTAQASGDGLAGSPVTFVQTALASTPSVLKEVSGNGQTAPAGFEVAEDLVVQLVDPDGNGVGGRPVRWDVSAGGGTVSPASSTTDPSGFARTRWTLGSAAGTNTLSATFSGLPPVPFTAMASSDVPSKIALASGNNQSGTVGQALASPLAVTVTDANDNPVQDVSVSWAVAGGGSVSSPTSATNEQGIAQITRTLGLTPGPYTTTATVVGLEGQSVAFVSTAAVGQVSASQSTVTATPTGVAAGVASTITVTARDAGGNPVPGAAIVLSATGSGNTIGQPVATSASGVATGTFTSTGPGAHTVKATANGIAITQTATVTVSAGPVSGTQSAVSASPAQIQVGGAPATVTVTARDGAGNPIAGASVALSATGGGNTLVQPSAPTGANGQATGTFTSAAVGAHTVSAAINGTPVTATATVAVTAGAVSGSQSTISAEPTDIAAGGASTVTVTVRDESGNPVEGASVGLSATGSGNNLSQPGATNASGVATGTFSSTSPGAHTITATANGTAISGNATVTVTAGTVSAAQSTLSSSPEQIQAGGGPATLTITARDASGNPVGGASVSLSVTGSGNTVSAPGPTNGSGVTTATFTSSQVGSHTITAAINGVTIADNVVVTVVSGPVNAGQSTIAASPGSVAAGASSTVTVTARDAGGNPVQGASVRLSATGSGNAIVQPSGATNASGVATGTFSSSAAGSHTISAAINGNGINATATVTVTPGAVSPSRSTVSTSPDALTAGGDQSTVTVTARDAGGNPIPGASVALSATGDGNTLSAPTPTNAGGVTTATFSSTAAGPHTISATIDGVPIDDNATVTVNPGAPASLAFTTQPTSTSSGATISPAPVVRITDAFGNATDGTVHLDLDPGLLSNGTLAGTVDVSSSGGNAVFSDLSVTSNGLLGFFQLAASVGGQFSTLSSSFTITP